MGQPWSRETSTQHIPVMVDEVLSFLNLHPDGSYLDGTIGLGGHATQLLTRLSTAGRLIGLDRDEEALEICQKNLPASSSAVSFFHTSYEHFSQILDQLDLPLVNGLLLDLGLSSFQLDSPDRGFAYNISSNLDMRFDPSSGPTAADLIQSSSSEELTRIFRDYGEERHAGRIARSIKTMGKVDSVTDLKEAIRRATPPAYRHKSMARIFQALRIAVNRELDRLVAFMDLFIERLAPGGRIVIISYHSLEDRIVKHGFKTLKAADQLKILTKKPVRPSEAEIRGNPRAKSAKLRAGERIT